MPLHQQNKDRPILDWVRLLPPSESEGSSASGMQAASAT